MPRLPRITAAELLKVLRRDGWFETRQKGSHLMLRHATKLGLVVIAMHRGESIPLGTVAQILRDAELTIDELRELL
jgi:predicted RNA binding protein YcfA (HicA-like mRNA interferase family)